MRIFRKSKIRKKNQPSVLRVNTHLRDLRNLRRRITRLLLVIIGIVFVFALLMLGARLVARELFSCNNLFRIRQYDIQCRGNTIKPDDVLAFPGLAACSNLFALDIKSVRNDWLRRIPRIKSVEISRRLPGVLSIRLSERVSVARLNMESYYLNVDSDGCVLGTLAGNRNLPVVYGHCMPGLKPGVFLDGTAVMNALDVLNVCATTPVGQSLAIVSFDVRNMKALEFSLKDGARVTIAWKHMGERTSEANEYLEKKLTKLAECLKESTSAGKQIVSVDMTLENNFPAIESQKSVARSQ